MQANYNFSHLPGGDLVATGINDICRGICSENALLVLIAATELRRLGLEVGDLPEVSRPREHQLFALLEQQLGDGAHSYYNSLIRKFSSFRRSFAITA